MDNLEKNLSNLPKPKLRRMADFKIKFRIYSFMFGKSIKNLAVLFLHPHSLALRVSYMILAIVVFLGAGGVYAANNENIIPGHSLYPLKKTVETVEQTLSFTKESQVNTLNKISERRLKEAINLATDNKKIESDEQENKESIGRNLDELVENLNEVINITTKINNQKQAQKIKDDVRQKNEEVIKYLDSLEDISKDKEDSETSDRINRAKKTIKNYQKILDDNQFRDRDDNDFKKSRKDKNDSRDYNIEIKEKNDSSDDDSADQNRDNNQSEDDREERD